MDPGQCALGLSKGSAHTCLEPRQGTACFQEELEHYKHIFQLLVDKAVLENMYLWEFPGGLVVKNPPVNAGDTGLIPGLGRFHMPWGN